MTGRYARPLTIAAAVGSGLAAGVFFAFSTFVMTALGRLPERQGLRAMQEINDAAPTPWFMVPLIGTALVCAVLVVLALRRPNGTPARYLLVGSALYLVGLAVTIAYHVPKNDDLALVNPNGAGAADAWNDYHSAWTAWNHVRTLAFLGAAVVFTVAPVSRRTSRTPVAEPASSVHSVTTGVPR